MPELPEVRAHAERLSLAFGGRILTRFTGFTFTVLKTVQPAPEAANGRALRRVRQRGKFILLEFEEITFVVHLMQGGRLVVDEKLSLKPRGGQARWTFTESPALLLTEQGTERRVGVWCVPTERAMEVPPLAELGPDATDVDIETLGELFLMHPMRLHGFLRDQHRVAGLGRRLANEVCHRARLSPFANTSRLTPDETARVHTAILDACSESLEFERNQPEMLPSARRPSLVHGRTGEPCTICGDTVRSVEYSDYTVNYCATCQTGGKVLADNTTSRFLK